MIDPQLRERIGEEGLRRLGTNFTAILPGELGRFPVYTHLRHILLEYSSREDLQIALQNPLWDQLALEIRGLLVRCPRLYFYIDAIDDNFSHAPAHWRRCQLGLLYQIARFLTDDTLARLHVSVTVRSMVLADFFNTSAGERLRGDRHIQILDWDDRSIRDFLRAKVSRLGAQDLMQPSGAAPTLEHFLGLKVVSQPGTGNVEDIEDYVLRHTSYVPRDIVLAGNDLVHHVRTAKRANSNIDSLPLDSLRDVMAGTARRAGDRRIGHIASHLEAQIFDSLGHEARTSTTYTTQSMNGVRTALERFLRTVFQKAILSRADIDGARRRASEFFDWNQEDVLNMIWRGGLIGYVKAEEERGPILHYYSLSAGDPLTLPEAGEYYLHHSLTHGLSISSGGIIAPPRR